MGQPHKHAAVIKAWADGEEIEYQAGEGSEWKPCLVPGFYEPYFYRVKPKNIVVSRKVYFDALNQITRTYISSDPNIEYTFDPEGKLLEAKVLK